MMMANDGNDRIWKINRRKNVSADRRMELHALELWLREWARLVQDVLGHCELAHVVQQGGRLDRSDLSTIVDTHRTRQLHGIKLNAADVTVCDLVFRVDCHRESLNRRQIQTIELRQMSVSILNPTECILKSQVRDE